MSKHGLSVQERIENKLDKSSGCWLWTGALSHGYGSITIKRESKLVHRVYWELINGDIPKGMCVCHHCDNPPCVSPEHLFLGTPTDNNRDRDEKGRHYQATQTHCKYNHPFDESNTHYYSIKRNGKQSSERCCRACNRRRNKDKYYRRKHG